MLLVLACTVFLLFIVPGMLFGLGRMIAANTDGRRRAVPAPGEVSAASARLEADGRGFHDPEQPAWFRRPMLPPFTRPTLFE